MRSDKAEFELLLTVARLLRAHLRETPDTDEDAMLLSDALKPFDPLPGHGGEEAASGGCARAVAAAVTYLPDGSSEPGLCAKSIGAVATVVFLTRIVDE